MNRRNFLRSAAAVPLLTRRAPFSYPPPSRERVSDRNAILAFRRAFRRSAAAALPTHPASRSSWHRSRLHRRLSSPGRSPHPRPPLHRIQRRSLRQVHRCAGHRRSCLRHQVPKSRRTGPQGHRPAKTRWLFRQRLSLRQAHRQRSRSSLGQRPSARRPPRVLPLQTRSLRTRVLAAFR